MNRHRSRRENASLRHISRSGPIYAIRLQAKADDTGIHGPRAILKVYLRRYGLRCVAAREMSK